MKRFNHQHEGKCVSAKNSNNLASVPFVLLNNLGLAVLELSSCPGNNVAGFTNTFIFIFKSWDRTDDVHQQSSRSTTITTTNRIVDTV